MVAGSDRAIHAASRVAGRGPGDDGRPGPTRFGAYGLVLGGELPRTVDLIADPPASWAEWRVDVTAAPRRTGDWTDHLDDERAVLALADGVAHIDRRAARTDLHLPRRPSLDELTHPFLAATGTVAARWRGDLPLHAGAVLLGGRVWGILGDREAGKSTSVAALWQAGAPVFTDDLLIIQGATAFAGPRTLDLREPTATALRIGEPRGIVGLRERWRVALEPVPAEAPVGGFITLAWGDTLSMELAEVRERAALLYAGHAVLAAPSDPMALLDVLTRPIWRLTRPRDLSQLPAMARLLMERVQA